MVEPEINYFAHLHELRNRLILGLLLIGGLTVLCFVYSDTLISVVTAPIQKSVNQLYFFAPYEAFLMRLKVSVTGGAIVSSPIIFMLLWQFIAPGLYQKEKRVALPLILASTMLFLAGVLFAHFCVIPFALKFFLGFQTSELQPLISIGSYVSFFLSIILVFGGVFVLPVVLVGLMFFDLVRSTTFAKHRKAVVVIAFILAAILTPTMDIVTQCLMAGPLWGLFEISLVIGKIFESRRARNKRNV